MFSTPTTPRRTSPTESSTSLRSFRTVAVLAGSAIALSITFAAPATAAVDSDRDGIPNRWERSHGMNPYRSADARADYDRDGLTNLGEYRHHSRLRDEDTDNDGHDDGDEVHDGFRWTRVLDRDSDDDGTRDGDEDSDHDGVSNEDEDDAKESCRRDDDDTDHDSVDDEDENELGTSVRDADSDDDGVRDGTEDGDHDGESNEDEDDDAEDVCSHDSDDDGVEDEDENDVLGEIASYDAETGVLTVTSVNGFAVVGTVTEDTEIDFEHVDGQPEPGEASTADLLVGTQVAEIDFEDDTDTIEEIELYQPVG
ncbi:MAG: hypothetical protein NTX33_01415 [Propionibacteriales bacterium]|nr:hypothetical protein [Propionibacteriales bacterium]